MDTTPVFWPGESHGWRSLVGYSPWGRTELNMTEATWHTESSLINSISCNMHTVHLITQMFKNTFLVTQMLKYLPAMQETQVHYLGWEDFLEKEMATHSNMLAWRTPRTEESGGL